MWSICIQVLISQPIKTQTIETLNSLTQDESSDVGSRRLNELNQLTRLRGFSLRGKVFKSLLKHLLKSDITSSIFENGLELLMIGFQLQDTEMRIVKHQLFECKMSPHQFIQASFTQLITFDFLLAFLLFPLLPQLLKFCRLHKKAIIQNSAGKPTFYYFFLNQQRTKHKVGQQV